MHTDDTALATETQSQSAFPASLANQLQITYVNVEDLKQHPKSPLRAPKSQVAKGLKAARAFGFNVPLLIDKNNQVLSSPYRLLVAQELKLDQVAVILIDHLSDEQIRAFQLSEYKIESHTQIDESKLVQELNILSGSIRIEEFDAIGFDENELIVLNNKFSMQNETTENEEIDFDSLNVSEFDVAVGDVWHMGEHRLVVGSSLDPLVWQELAQALNLKSFCERFDKDMGIEPGSLPDGNTVRLILTDPPYNVKVKGHVSSARGGGHEEFAMASGEMSDAEFDEFLARVLALATDELDDGGLVYAFMDWRHMDQLNVAARANQLSQLNLAVWSKDQAGMGSFYRSQHELVGIYKKGSAPHTNNVQLGKNGRNRSNVWSYPAVRRIGKSTADGERGQGDLASLHPTVKPVELLMDVLLDCTQPGEVVLDPFGGSGSLVLAAERARRRAGLIEIEPKFAAVTLARFKRFTGQDPVKQ